MRIVSVEIKNNDALKLLRYLESSKIIRILPDETDSPVVDGPLMSVKNFKQWVKNSEEMPTVSLPDAELKWEQKNNN